MKKKDEKLFKQRIDEMLNYKSEKTEKAVRGLVADMMATPSEQAEKTFRAYLDTVAHIERDTPTTEPSTTPSKESEHPVEVAEPHNDGDKHVESNQEIFTRVLRRAIDETLTEPTGAVVLSVRSIVSIMLAEYFSTYGTRETFLHDGWLDLCETLGALLDKNKGFPGTTPRAEVMDLLRGAICHVKMSDEYQTEILPRQRRDRLRHIDRYVDMFTRERDTLLADKAEHPENY